MAVQQASDDRKARAAAALATKDELKALDGQVAEAQAEVQRRAPDVEAKVAEAAQQLERRDAADAEMQQLDSKQARATQFKSRQERDKHLNKEAAELRTKIKKKEQQARPSPPRPHAPTPPRTLVPSHPRTLRTLRPALRPALCASSMLALRASSMLTLCELSGCLGSWQAATLQKDLEQAQARQDQSANSASEGRKRLEACHAKRP